MAKARSPRLVRTTICSSARPGNRAGATRARNSPTNFWRWLTRGKNRCRSGLAEGADQLVATAALERGAYLAAVLPLPKDLYRSLMSEPARAEFDRLLSQAALVIELPYDDVAELANSEEAGVRQYCALEDFLALHC